MKLLKISREGACALTKMRGTYVKSHLIPVALTRLSRTGEKYVEMEIGQGVKKRPNSWYDSNLVTREGEKILAAIDTQGIELLRSHKLVWSGWDFFEDLTSQLDNVQESDLCLRLLAINNTQALQLFFLSLLWRAGSTSMQEFSDVHLTDEVLEDLRFRVVNRTPGALHDYPVQLFQLITRGVPHNRTPTLERKPVDNLLVDECGLEVSYVRFYFDGLVAHVHLPSEKMLAPEYLQTCLGLGVEGKTLVVGHKFTESRAWENMKEIFRTVRADAFIPPFRKTGIYTAVNNIPFKSELEVDES